ncbi:adhesion G-protein coupled receptor D1-like isoform X2 [Dendronephthya gigantea]|uniref:adhesion G-protein coupled receptor D1-like isoform X2 n=1 Tax=Dendronephthya gigantea TaxID=151771 RepID=UPI00106AB427|nr:adhesion G-protein coupled receptor D1-like isoform X2 [Dendronephthya gigantea]
MLAHENLLYFLIAGWLLCCLSGLKVGSKSKDKRCKRVSLHYNTSLCLTLEEAKNYCSKHNNTLFEFDEDEELSNSNNANRFRQRILKACKIDKGVDVMQNQNSCNNNTWCRWASEKKILRNILQSNNSSFTICPENRAKKSSYKSLSKQTPSDNRLPFICGSEILHKEMLQSYFRNEQLGETGSKAGNQPFIDLKPARKLIALRNFTKKMIELVNSTCSDESLRAENARRSKMEITVWNSFERGGWKKTGIMPFKSIRKLCQGIRRNCTVKRIIHRLRNVSVSVDNLWTSSPLTVSEIITLDYIANGQLLSALDNETISLSFSNTIKNVLKEQVKCLFLDGEKWSDKNMSVGPVYEENITCLARHLTSFTMVILPKTDKIGTSDEKALDILYYIGSGLSLAALLFSCIIYVVLYKDLKILTTSRHLVHFNLQIALGLTQLVFLVGGVATENEVACKVAAILVHYFSLASFVWIFLEAVMLYLKLISVYSGEFVRMKNFMIFGWGFPLIFVGFTAGIKTNMYGTEEWCWISYENDFTWVFLAPAIIVVTVTLVVVIAVARVVFRLSKSKCTDTKKRIISAARGVMILFPTLGLSWAFCVIAFHSDDLVWRYLFTIFASLQIRVAIGRRIGPNVTSSYST